MLKEKFRTRIIYSQNFSQVLGQNKDIFRETKFESLPAELHQKQIKDELQEERKVSRNAKKNDEQRLCLMCGYI